MSTSFQTLQEADSIYEFFNLVATETLALFEHLEFEFLTEYDVFAPGGVICVRADTGSETEPMNALLSCDLSLVEGAALRKYPNITQITQ